MASVACKLKPSVRRLETPSGLPLSAPVLGFPVRATGRWVPTEGLRRGGRLDLACTHARPARTHTHAPHGLGSRARPLPPLLSVLSTCAPPRTRPTLGLARLVVLHPRHCRWLGSTRPRERISPATLPPLLSPRCCLCSLRARLHAHSQLSAWPISLAPSRRPHLVVLVLVIAVIASVSLDVRAPSLCRFRACLLAPSLSPIRRACPMCTAHPCDAMFLEFSTRAPSHVIVISTCRRPRREEKWEVRAIFITRQRERRARG